MARLTVNGKTSEVNVDPNTPLLWALREQVGAHAQLEGGLKLHVRSPVLGSVDGGPPHR